MLSVTQALYNLITESTEHIMSYTASKKIFASEESVAY